MICLEIPAAKIRLEGITSALIRSSNDDDALCYQAPIKKKLSPNSYLVYFHRTSRLLERARIFGSCHVHVEFFGAESFVGELKIDREHDPAQDSFALVLELHERAPAPCSKEQPIYLRT